MSDTAAEHAKSMYDAELPTEFSDRVGRCYELAAKYVLAHPGSELVHGSIQGMGHPRNDHAWVVLDNGWCHCPVSALTLPPDAFERFSNSIETHRFSRADVSANVVTYEHWGPWDV